MLQKPAKEFKLVLVGDSAVGKSSLLNRFVDKTFNQSLLSTIGVDFKFKKVNIDGHDIKLQIWDTAGQETFRSIVSAYYSSADAIIIVYDITSYESFDNIKEYWIEEAENNNKNNAKIFLIGNKIDQESRRAVENFSIESFMEEHNVSGLYQASAKTGTNVENSFISIAESLFYNKSSLIGKQRPVKQIKQQKNRESTNSSGPKNQDEQNRYENQSRNQQEYQNSLKKYEKEEKQENYPQQLQRQGSSRIKINKPPQRSAKNPNYNKSCCLK